MKLLTVENAKTVKGERLGYLTGILYLAPANESRVMNVCPYATAECRHACLFTAGRGVMDNVRKGRIRKTRLLAKDPRTFYGQLEQDIHALVDKAKREGLTPAIRLNGTSDLPAMALRLVDKFPEVQFYDYTKIPRPWLRVRPNYHLTYSHSGENTEECFYALAYGVNVAVVFDTRKGDPLPESWHGYPVVDGDVSDLRFLDAMGVVVGLRAKGRARQAAGGGFVQIANVSA